MATDVTIRIPEATAKLIELRIKGSRYSSIEEYVIDLVRTTVEEPAHYTQAEEKELKRRLRSLGYE